MSVAMTHHQMGSEGSGIIVNTCLTLDKTNGTTVLVRLSDLSSTVPQSLSPPLQLHLYRNRKAPNGIEN